VAFRSKEKKKLKSEAGIRNFITRLASIAVLLILVCHSILWSQDENEESGPSLSATLDRDSARVGDIVTLILSYRLPEGAGFSDTPEITGLEELTAVDREIGPGEIRIKILVDQLGTWKTGPISLSYLDKEGKTQTLVEDPVSLTVLSNLGEKPEEAELRPIQGIIPTKSLWLKPLPWIGGGLVLLLIALGALWWYRKHRHEKFGLMAQAPPHVWAVKEIEELVAQKLFEKGQAKAFYFRFSEILRHFLEAIRGFPAAEFTTEEIARQIDNEEDRKLLSLLRQADLVKFADTVPTPARKEEEVKAALGYIHETSPAIETDYSPVGNLQKT
jgi:hypothetical protein